MNECAAVHYHKRLVAWFRASSQGLLILAIGLCLILPSYTLFRHNLLSGADGGYYARYLNDYKIQRLTMEDRVIHSPVFFYPAWLVSTLTSDFLAINFVTVGFIVLLALAVYLFSCATGLSTRAATMAVVLVLSSPCLLRMVTDIRKQSAGLGFFTLVLWSYVRNRAAPRRYLHTTVLLLVGILTHRSVGLALIVLLAHWFIKVVSGQAVQKSELLLLLGFCLVVIAGGMMASGFLEFAASPYPSASPEVVDSWENFGAFLAPLTIALVLLLVVRPMQFGPQALTWTWLATLFLLSMPQVSATNTWRFQVMLYVPLGILCASALDHGLGSSSPRRYLTGFWVVVLVQGAMSFIAVVRNPILLPSFPLGGEQQLLQVTRIVPRWSHVYAEPVLGFWVEYLAGVPTRSYANLLIPGTAQLRGAEPQARFLIRYNPALFGWRDQAIPQTPVDIVVRVERTEGQGSWMVSLPVIFRNQSDLFQVFEVPPLAEPYLIDGADVDAILKHLRNQPERQVSASMLPRLAAGFDLTHFLVSHVPRIPWRLLKQQLPMILTQRCESVLAQTTGSNLGTEEQKPALNNAESKWHYGSTWVTALLSLAAGVLPENLFLRYLFLLPLNIFCVSAILRALFSILSRALSQRGAILVLGCLVVWTVVAHPQRVWGPRQTAPEFRLIHGARVERLLEDEQVLLVERYYRDLTGQAALVKAEQTVP